MGIIKYIAALYFSVAWIVKNNESYSIVIRKHKYKDKDKDKETDKVPEKPNICYFLILMTYSFQMKYDDRYLMLVSLFSLF